MNRITLISTLLILWWIPPLQAQIPDLLDARGYFPLALGNSWEYEHVLERPATTDRPSDASETRFERYTVVALRDDDNPDDFALVYSEWSPTRELLTLDTVYVRFDLQSSSISGDRLPGILSFLRCLGSPFFPIKPIPTSCWPNVLTSVVFIPELFGAEATLSKQLSSFVWVVELVHGVGAVHAAGGCEPCGPLDDRDTWRLAYARVAGESFGASVVTTEPDARDQVAASSVYPNPARDWVVVTGIPGTRVSIFDILGRKKRQEGIDSGGRVRIEVSSLSPGIYVVVSGNGTQLLVRL